MTALATQVIHVGRSREPLIVVACAADDLAELVDAASALAPFPPSGNYYPGLRQPITREMAAHRPVAALLDSVAPLIFDCFDCTGFESVDPSFSMVTLDPGELSAAQRVPHFDSPDPDYLAMLLYLSDTPGTGTAFFRQRATGIERVDPHNIALFLAAAQVTAGERHGYAGGSDDEYEQIGAVAAQPGRVAIYRGGLLHSGIIPASMRFSSDPRVGRLTLNLFLRVSR